MKNGPESYSPEEILKIEKKRTISDSDLLQDGAEYVFDNKKSDKRLKLSETQLNDITPDGSKIQKEIMEGNFENVEKLTEINKEIAKILSSYTYPENHRRLSLENLSYLSDECADILFSNLKADEVHLSGLKTISDNVAKSIANWSYKNSRNFIDLDGLNSISDSTAEILSHHHGNLTLKGLTSLSDKSGSLLARHFGGELLIPQRFKSKLKR